MATKLTGFLVDPRRPDRRHLIRRRTTIKAPLETVFAYYIAARAHPLNEHYMQVVRRVLGFAQRQFGRGRCLTEIMPRDVRNYIEMALGRGIKTRSVERELSILSATSELYLRDKGLPILNPFYRARVPKCGHDSKTFVGIPPDQLIGFKTLCYQMDDPLRWLLALLVDTGARSSEIAGASLEDFHLDHSPPYLAIEAKPWRRLKTRHSRRQIPLAGIALWAACRVVANAERGQVHAFPGCIKNKRMGGFGSTLNYWMRSREFPYGPHSLRHAFIDRLRDVDCPIDVRRRMLGWAGRTPEAKYGAGPALEVLAVWIRRIALDDYRDFASLGKLLEASEPRRPPAENAQAVLAGIEKLGSPTFAEMRARLRLGFKDLKRGLDYGRKAGAIRVLPPEPFECRQHFRYVATGQPIPDRPWTPANLRPRTRLPRWKPVPHGDTSIASAACFAQNVSTQAGWQCVSPRRPRWHCSPKAVPILQPALPSSTETPRSVRLFAERIFSRLTLGEFHSRTEIIERANLTVMEYWRGRYHLHKLGIIEILTVTDDGQLSEVIRLTGRPWHRMTSHRTIPRTKVAFISSDSELDGRRWTE